MKTSNKQMKQKNAKKIFFTIKENGPISKREIQEETGLGWATISVMVSELMEKGCLNVVEKSDTTVGRKPELLDISNQKFLLCGIEFSSDAVLAVVTDLKGRVQSSIQRKLTVKTREGALTLLYDVLDELFARYREKIIRISLGVQGVVDTQEGISVKIDQIQGWKNVPLKEFLEGKYNIPTTLIHDPDCMMQAEKILGNIHVKATSNVLMVTLNDHGIGMSVLSNGRINYGLEGSFGEIDRTIVAPGTDRIYLAQHCDGKGIQMDYELIKHERPLLNTIIARAAAGEEEAMRMFGQYAEYLGTALVNAIMLFNSDCVILRGSLCRCSDFFFDELEHFVKEHSDNRSIQIRLSQLGEFACANGAALFAADMAIREICDNV